MVTSNFSFKKTAAVQKIQSLRIYISIFLKKIYRMKNDQQQKKNIATQS